MQRVLVIDSTSDVSPVIPYLFRRANCVVDVFCFKRSPLSKHRYYDHWFEVACADAGSYIERLKGLLNQIPYDWILPANDPTNRLLNEMMLDNDLLLKILPISKIENRIMVGSKAGLSILCDRYGILSPPSAIYDGSVPASELAKKVTYPLLLKEDYSSAGRGIHFCDNDSSMEESLKKIDLKKKNNLVFQKYIPGRCLSVEALYRKGQLLGYSNSVFTKTVGDEFGISLERLYFHLPEIESDLQAIGEKLGINGFGTMTFIEEEETKKRYLVEADLRPQVWFRYAKFCGVDFSDAIRNFLTGSDKCLRPELPNGKNSVLMWHFFRNVKNFAKRGIDTVELLRWVFNVEGRWNFIPWYGWRFFFQALSQLRSVRFLP